MTETGNTVDRLREKATLLLKLQENIGEGEWTAQDVLATAIAEKIPALLAVVEAAQEVVDAGTDPLRLASSITALRLKLAALHSQASDEGDNG